MKLRIAIEVSEPWQLTRADSAPPLLANVKDLRAGEPTGDRATLLLELLKPLEFEGVSYRQLVAQVHGSPTLQALADGARVEADIYGVPANEEIADPLNPSWWRGGLGIIGALKRG